MTTYNWSALTNGQILSTFNASNDVLVFDDTSISAAAVVVNGDNSVIPPYITLSFSGKTVTINIDPLSTTTTNVTFANGSLLLIGDNTAGTAGDDGANTLTGGGGNDHLIGLSGNDSLDGGSGNDLFTMYTGTLDTWGNDIIRGGGGTDTINFNTGDTAAFGLVVTYTGFDVTLGALATITGGDGSPGSTITMSGVERVNGTNLADTFTGTTAIPINGLRSDITLVFEGAGGNDVINGATGDGRTTFISYRSSGSGVTVNLGSGTASNDGLGGADTFNNIDGVLGSNFADAITGGSGSIGSASTLNEYYEGFGGNDTINGGSGTDRVQYDNSPGTVVINLANGTAQDGWGGFDTLISIEQVRGSAFNDTMLGSVFDDQFEGANGNDFIDGGAGFDSVRYTQATGAVYVNLATGEGRALDTLTGASAGVDFFTHIEDARGSDFADSLVGGGDGLIDSAAGVFNGAEAFEGRAGNDTIDGGDTVVGSGSIDLVRYLNAPSAVIVNLSAGTVLGVASNTANDGYGVNGNLAGIDTLININGIEGSSFNDTLVGGNNDEFFQGRKGVDSIVGGGGIDTLVNDNAPAAVTINLGTGVYNDGWGTVDVVSGIENVSGTDFDDTLTGDANANRLEGGLGVDTLAGGLGNDTLVGGEDNDTANYSAASGAVTVNLTTGTATGADGADTLIGIEYVFGSNSNDTITGNEEQNFIRGNGGDDVLDGAGHSLALAVGNFAGDFADYQNAPGAVTVSLAIVGPQNTVNAGTDTLTNFEGIRGSASGDTLTGDGGNNFLRGGLGDDTLDGGGGIDWADYRSASGAVSVTLATQGVGQNTLTDGTDTLINIEALSGSDFNDTLTGSSGDNWFRGRNGNDSINGGAGFDMVTYSFEAAAVNINLTTDTVTTAAGGTTGTDTVISIEAAEGTVGFNDTLTGANGEDNALYGLGGNDLLRITTGSVNGDTINGGTGTDRIDFTQTGVVYTGATGVTVNLTTHVADLNNNSGGAGETSTLTSIETVTGTTGNDSLTGGDASHAVDGFGNSLTEAFQPGAGNDTITGGAHGAVTMLGKSAFNTVVDYSGNSAGQAVNVVLGTGGLVGSANDGQGGTDTLFSVGQVRGGSGNDSLVGGSLNRTASGTFFEIFRGNDGNDTLDGGNAASDGDDASTDRADYANNTSVQAINVNLQTGIVLDGRGGTDTLINFRQVYGGAGNDTFLGGAENDAFDGGIGNDTLNGGAGTDEARFSQSTAGVIVNLSASSIFINATTVAAETASDGMGGTDTLISIESVRGSSFGDYIRGSDNVNTRQFFLGDDGNDTIDGGAGIDFANYSNAALAAGGLNAFIENGSGTVSDQTGGTDTLINIEGLAGTSSNDTLTGGAGDQWFRGNGGSDSIDGGSGSDWVLYSSDPSGVTINLGTGTATDGWNGLNGLLALGGTDTLVSIENAEASDYGDNITGSSVANELRGRAGNDILNGGAGVDILAGDSGDDYLYGGEGADNLDGGAGYDYARYDFAASGVYVRLDSGAGFAGEATGDVLTGIEGVVGSNADDGIIGDANVNVLYGLGGVDVIYGLGGNDYVFGNDGDDYLYGGEGADNLDGGAGYDYARYDSSGTGVYVRLDSGAGFTGEATGDVLTGIEGVVGSNADDAIVGDANVNVLYGLGGVDVIYGLGGNDYVFGNDGDDYLYGGEGADNLDGGAGYDYARYDSSGTGVYVRLDSGAGFTGEATGDVLTGIEGVVGSNADDAIVGDANVNVLYGLGGVDVIYGLGGNDYVFGNDGDDYLYGGEGADNLDGGAGYDYARYDFAASGVYVRLDSGAGFAGEATGDVLTGIEGVVGSNADDGIIGDANVNVLYGLGGVDVIYGLGGNDYVFGNDGDDYLYGGEGADNLDGGAGYDYARYDSSGTGVYVRLDSGAGFTGEATGDVLTGIEGVVGSNADDAIVGDANVNVLYGLGGVDVIYGLGGNDYVFGNDGDDYLYGGEGADNLDGGAGYDYARYDSSGTGVYVRLDSGAGFTGEATGDVLTGIEGVVGSNADDAIVGDANVNVLYGLGGVDVIYGLGGNDYVFGNDGNDFLYGGNGNDLLSGGANADSYLFESGSNVDTVIDFLKAESDKIYLQSNLNGSGITSGALALTHTSDVGGDATIDLGAGNSITLLGVSTASLAASDFVIF